MKSVSQIKDRPDPTHASLPVSRVTRRFCCFSLCVWQVTSSFAVLNLAVVGSPKAWTALVHVDWRAWPVGVANLPQTHNYEVHTLHTSHPDLVAKPGCVTVSHPLLTICVPGVAGAHRIAASV